MRIDPLFQAPEPARASAGSLTFEPGARAAWHTHPLGQTLIIVASFGCMVFAHKAMRVMAGNRDRFVV